MLNAIKRLFSSPPRAPSFTLSLPPELPWADEEPSENHVTLVKKAPSRGCFISAHFFDNTPSLEGRNAVFVDMYDLRLRAEVGAGGDGTIVDHAADLDGPVWTAQYVRLHPSASRIALCRMLCDEASIHTLYYEAYGLTKEQFDNEVSRVSFKLAAI
jgi:hypothetical protein